MGNNPVNMVDPDGGWSAGATGALIGGVVGAGVLGVALPYLYEEVMGKPFKGKEWWAFGGALLGSGVGFGWAETYYVGGNFFLNMQGFYMGLYGSNKREIWAGGRPQTSSFGMPISGRVPNIWGNVNFNFNIWRDGIQTQTISELALGPILMGSLKQSTHNLGYPEYVLDVDLPPTADKYRLNIEGDVNLSDYNYSSEIPSSGKTQLQFMPNLVDILKREAVGDMLDNQSGNSHKSVRDKLRRDMFKSNNESKLKIYRDSQLDRKYRYPKFILPLKFIRRYQ